MSNQSIKPGAIVRYFANEHWFEAVYLCYRDGWHILRAHGGYQVKAKSVTMVVSAQERQPWAC